METKKSKFENDQIAKAKATSLWQLDSKIDHDKAENADEAKEHKSYITKALREAADRLDEADYDSLRGLVLSFGVENKDKDGIESQAMIYGSNFGVLACHEMLVPDLDRCKHDIVGGVVNISAEDIQRLISAIFQQNPSEASEDITKH